MKEEPNVTCSVDNMKRISFQEKVFFLILKFVTHFKAEIHRCDSLMLLLKKTEMNYS